MKTAIIIPAMNEEASIRMVISTLPVDLVQNVIVVNDGSSDNTAKIARDVSAS